MNRYLKLNSINNCLILFFCAAATLASCLAKKPIANINREEGEALDPIVVSKNNPLHIYRATTPIDFLLQETELWVSFDMQKHTLNGKAMLALKALPYKPCSNIILDAKKMKIDSVTVVNGTIAEPCQYVYKNDKLEIQLRSPLLANEITTIIINYIAEPDSKPMGGSGAIRGDKGLYFINSTAVDSFKPVQIWTQGETESNSNWFPTVDKPNAKSSFTLHITVPAQYQTLSNGKNTLSVTNKNGTRTDTWRQAKAMSPYLVMMAIGKYAVAHDTWRGKDVDYYVEPAYGSAARKNFEHTTEMMSFFSDQLETEFPWDKYSQVTARDYVSGAMENTSCSLFGEFVQKHEAELIDNGNDGIVAHELFHQWFGDLVGCESWSNLFLNEGFATYGEYLWAEHKYGKDEADRLGYSDLNRYLNYSEADDGAVVRFHYKERENMFSPITYKKGGRVLHLLRTELGDDVFFKGLALYLDRYKHKAAEVHQLRQCMEEVSGTDLTQFFQQWLYKGSHPTVFVHYNKIDNSTLRFYYQQQNDSNYIFKTAINYLIQNNGKELKYALPLQKKSDSADVNISSLTLHQSAMPTIVADATHSFLGLLVEEIDQATAAKNYSNSSNYTDAMRALYKYISFDTANFASSAICTNALLHSNKHIRTATLRTLLWKQVKFNNELLPILEKIAAQDNFAPNRIAALDIFTLKKHIDTALYKKIIATDSSDGVIANAIEALLAVDASNCYNEIKPFYYTKNQSTVQAVAAALSQVGSTPDTSFFKYHIPRCFGNTRIALLQAYTAFAQKNTAESIYKSWLNTQLFFARNDERESIRIACVKNLHGMMESYVEKNADRKQKLIVIINDLIAAETNNRALAEYKRVGYIK